MPKRTAKPAAKPAASSLTKSVSWPPFKPRLPVLDLDLSLHPSSDKIALVPCFFPKSLCRDYVSFLKTLPLQTTPGRPKRGEAVRVNDRFQVDDPDFARRLWEDTGLREALLDTEHANHLWGGNPVGLNPNIRVYRYSAGQYFDTHYDDSNIVELPSTPAGSARTTWTLLLYLTSSTEGCVGGETVFYTHDRQVPAEEIAVQLETGLLLLHKHGQDCLLVRFDYDVYYPFVPSRKLTSTA
ncbi:hypothetical protein S7711_00548 [Stachybotrys chartarum IBT 7711]|uniref:Prolyl 4-hydroxylase alpha subunit Fe(2+) 2OG dioxygenase domain-containing protein n=1 Tax=Stachybotrys chartarum (strain CBS 109288 / IBT 7711) TaxID=1280523 RepID=A0A084ATP5_STACB|nr:hypothetical protein S7711_00548 [Stachybotrys chartarum IBT 7711]KFA49743.1 hypothetical protein S40293_01360 [Stachybotrys chartarum IBT 40293]